MFTILDYSSALEYSIIRCYTNIIYYYYCHSDEVMREDAANDTSGEMGSELPGSIVCESVFRTSKLEILTESAS